jgi:methylenetetrahydrofolate dehydrogenase (NADP+)/methenyltetrahydrofolate cyclohydrolase/formyltetrahydrofolate synthetase
MTATKIDGTAIAKSIRERLGGYIKEKQASNPRYRPSLKIVQGRHHHTDTVHCH